MSILANSEGPDEMSHNAAFHQGIHCFLGQTQSSKKEKQFYLEIIAYDSSIHTMDHPQFSVSNQKEESINTKRTYCFL